MITLVALHTGNLFRGPVQSRALWLLPPQFLQVDLSTHGLRQSRALLVTIVALHDILSASYFSFT